MHGIYLEDLYIRPGHRGTGLGKALLTSLAAIAVARGYARVEWWVLAGITPSIDFYRRLGAVPMDDWSVFRLTGDALTRAAAVDRHRLIGTLVPRSCRTSRPSKGSYSAKRLRAMVPPTGQQEAGPRHGDVATEDPCRRRAAGR